MNWSGLPSRWGRHTNLQSDAFSGQFHAIVIALAVSRQSNVKSGGWHAILCAPAFVGPSCVSLVGPHPSVRFRGPSVFGGPHAGGAGPTSAVDPSAQEGGPSSSQCPARDRAVSDLELIGVALSAFLAGLGTGVYIRDEQQARRDWRAFTLRGSWPPLPEACSLPPAPPPPAPPRSHPSEDTGSL
jgi:hypothetical protein